nr:hypothetical protein L204_00040 [Cryptococcus depauperatus CBS 7855]
MEQSHSQPVTSKGAIPTNIVTYKAGRRIPARIDPEARVAYIVEIMSTSFVTEEHHLTLCLRDQEDVLVTQNNLPSKVYNHDVLKLCASPTTEALLVVASLKVSQRFPTLDSPTTPSSTTSNDHIPLKLALFNLQKYVKEEEFSIEFLFKGGMKTLIKLLEKDEGGLNGNSLAYALQGVRGILEFESGWSELTDPFILRLLNILISSSQPNILRPATAILRKLAISTPPTQAIAGTGDNGTGVSSRQGYFLNGGKDRERSKGRRKDKEKGKDERRCYGFDKIYTLIKSLDLVHIGEDDENAIANAEFVFKILIKRLEGTGDLELVAETLGLINACLRSGHQEGSRQYYELAWIVEHLGIRRYISRLLSSNTSNVISPHILNFQTRLCLIIQHKRFRSVRPTHHAHQNKMLHEIWEAGRLENLVRGGEKEIINEIPGTTRDLGLGEVERSLEGWRMIGLGNEGEGGMISEGEMFRNVGELGLECLHWFAIHEERFYNLVIEQHAKSPERRCPIGKASGECVKLLCEHYKISQAGHYNSTAFQPFLLNFPRLHHLTLKFFLRMWQESNSQISDFPRLTHLIRSQLSLSLTDESSKTWLHLESDFLSTDYRTIRDRQMDLLEREDGMMQRNAVRSLKEKVGKEVWEVICEQRIGCMLQGSWFNSATIVTPGLATVARPSHVKPLRFLRLSEDKKVIAWDDFSQRHGSPSFESLSRRLQLSEISAIRTQTSHAVNSRSPLASKLSFSLISNSSTGIGSSELSLLDVDAIHAAQLAEWSDGIRVLKDEGMVSQDSANYVHVLTELALNVRLLDITGDGVEIPEKIVIGAAPQSVDFVFAK